MTRFLVILFVPGLLLTAVAQADDDCRLTLLGQAPASGLLCVDPPLAFAGSKIYDISDPTNIVLRSTLPASGPIAAGDGFAVTHSFGMLVRVFDISDPSMPVELPSYLIMQPMGLANAVATDNEYLYIATGPSIEIVKLSNVGPHEKVASIAKPTITCAVHDEHLIADEWLFDVSDPANPLAVSSLSLCCCSSPSRPSLTTTRAVVGSYSGYCGMVTAYDIANPAKPLVLTSLSAATTRYFAIMQESIATSYAVLGVGYKLGLFSVSQPAVEIATLPLKPQHDIASDGTRLYVLDSGQLRIYSVDPCYANCDCNASALDIDDFICFQTRFALADPYADCDADGELTVDDFVCFQTAYAVGC